MKNGLIFSLIYFASGFCQAQIDAAPVVEIVKMSVYNPTDQELTLIVTNKRAINGLFPVRFATLLPNDTTLIPFEIISLEGRVPRDDYSFSIYVSRPVRCNSI